MEGEPGRRRLGWAVLAGVATFAGTLVLGFGTALWIAFRDNEDPSIPSQLSVVLLPLATIALAIMGLWGTAVLAMGRGARPWRRTAAVVVVAALVAGVAVYAVSVVAPEPLTTATLASQNPAVQRANWPDDLLAAAERAEGIMDLTLTNLTAVRPELNVGVDFTPIPPYAESQTPASRAFWCNELTRSQLRSGDVHLVDYDPWEGSPPGALPAALAVIRDTWVDMGLDVQEDWPLPDDYVGLMARESITVLSAVLDDGTELKARVRVQEPSEADADYLWVFARYRTACYPTPASPTTTAG